MDTLGKIFTPTLYSLQRVGKRMKSTKLRTLWEFNICDKKYRIELYISRISGKRRIFVNGELFAVEKKVRYTLATYSFNFGKNFLELKEIRNNYFDLFLDNVSFQNLYNS